jgi:hypothetical protein
MSSARRLTHLTRRTYSALRTRLIWLHNLIGLFGLFCRSIDEDDRRLDRLIRSVRPRHPARS